MNVYDFDGTIYKKDASIMFYRYFVRKYPQFGISTFWNILKAFCKYKLRQCSKEAFKSEYFSFIRHIEDLTAFVDQFVDMESQNINAWYLNRQKEDDVIISASPDFLVRAFADSLNIECVIASDVEISTGMWIGRNCYGEEKLARFREKFGDRQIDEFYSDSVSDKYLAEISEKAFLIRRGRMEKWEVHKI